MHARERRNKSKKRELNYIEEIFDRRKKRS